MSAEPVAVPLVGFRRWGARRGSLYSGIFVAGRFMPNPALRLIAPRVRPVPWPAHEDRVAKCFALGGHDAPHRDCNCGFAAYYELPAEPEMPAPEAVWGVIAGWGHIVECEHGFRAQFARPLALLKLRYPDDAYERGRRLENVAEAYEIPLLERDELVVYAGWHGELRAA
ncbi:MAG TPA: hypothetical protein VNA28_07835 [Solirubrobacteraceae bacterium]|nr:hypothetical protein [Solirubrobacteraceae bacterium]